MVSALTIMAPPTRVTKISSAGSSFKPCRTLDKVFTNSACSYLRIISKIEGYWKLSSISFMGLDLIVNKVLISARRA